MGRKLLLLFLLFPFIVQAQMLGPKPVFSQVIEKNIKKYRIQSQLAYIDNDFERADMLYDSLISKVINGSYLDNFKLNKLSGSKVELYDFEKPIMLMTYASWCTPGVGEIPALNKIAIEHHKEIDFVILFWDSKNKVKKASKNYNKHVRILYVDELENTNSHVVETMKHSLGFPTTFFIDENKKILDVRRGVLHTYNDEYEISYELNYSSFLNGVSLLKTTTVISSDGMVTND